MDDGASWRLGPEILSAPSDGYPIWSVHLSGLTHSGSHTLIFILMALHLCPPV